MIRKSVGRLREPSYCREGNRIGIGKKLKEKIKKKVKAAAKSEWEGLKKAHGFGGKKKRSPRLSRHSRSKSSRNITVTVRVVGAKSGKRKRKKKKKKRRTGLELDLPTLKW